MEDYQEILIPYLLGDLSEKEALQMKSRLLVDPDLNREFLELKEMWDNSQNIPIAQAEPHASERFEQWLVAQKDHHSQEPAHIIGLWKYAAAASVLLLLGMLWFLGSGPQEQIMDQPAQTNLLQWTAQESSTERIKGIHTSVREKSTDPDIVRALIKILQSDKSPNVRLTAVEAVQSMASSEESKQGLLKALENEKTPVVQIAIINALVSVQAGNAKEGFQELINKEEIETYVKDEAQLGLMRL